MLLLSRCRQAVKVETDDRHTDARTRYYWYHWRGWWSGYPLPLLSSPLFLPSVLRLGIYKRNLEQANSNHFVLTPGLSLFRRTNERMYLRSICAPFAREMGTLRDALAVGKGRVGKRKAGTKTKHEMTRGRNLM